MRRFSFNQKIVVIGICCIFMLIVTMQPAQAARRSHGLAITLLISGVGLKVGSTLLHTSAEKQYEDYLSATIQADIQNRKSDVESRENASVIMSRVGFGFIGLAALLSIFNQIGSVPTETVPAAQMQGNQNLNTQHLTSLVPSRLSLSNQILGESHLFRFRPHYDFQRQRVSLQFSHRF